MGTSNQGKIIPFPRQPTDKSPAGVTLIPPRIPVGPWIVLLVLTLGFFMILLDMSVVSVAIPRMEKGLNTSFDQILWVMNAYTLTYPAILQHIVAVYHEVFNLAFLNGLRPSLIVPAIVLAPAIAGALFLRGGWTAGKAHQAGSANGRAAS